MKKLLSLLAVMPFALAACGGGSNPDPSPGDGGGDPPGDGGPDLNDADNFGKSIYDLVAKEDSSGNSLGFGFLDSNRDKKDPDTVLLQLAGGPAFGGGTVANYINRRYNATCTADTPGLGDCVVEGEPFGNTFSKAGWQLDDTTGETLVPNEPDYAWPLLDDVMILGLKQVNHGLYDDIGLTIEEEYYQSKGEFDEIEQSKRIKIQNRAIELFKDVEDNGFTSELFGITIKNAERVYKTVKYWKGKGKNVTVIGSSYGAFLAQFTLSLHPEVLEYADNYVIDSGRANMKEYFKPSFERGEFPTFGLFDGATEPSEDNYYTDDQYAKIDTSVQMKIGKADNAPWVAAYNGAVKDTDAQIDALIQATTLAWAPVVIGWNPFDATFMDNSILNMSFKEIHTGMSQKHKDLTKEKVHAWYGRYDVQTGAPMKDEMELAPLYKNVKNWPKAGHIEMWNTPEFRDVLTYT